MWTQTQRVRDSVQERFSHFWDWFLLQVFGMHLNHRRRIKTEKKVVAAVWGTELIKFLVALDICGTRTI